MGDGSHVKQHNSAPQILDFSLYLSRTAPAPCWKTERLIYPSTRGGIHMFLFKSADTLAKGGSTVCLFDECLCPALHLFMWACAIDSRELAVLFPLEALICFCSSVPIHWRKAVVRSVFSTSVCAQHCIFACGRVPATHESWLCCSRWRHSYVSVQVFRYIGE